LFRLAPFATLGGVGEATLIFERIAQGDRRAADDLLPLVYGELRRLAAAKMARESFASTLQPTALVHEAWLRLGGAEQPDWQSRRHFFGAAAEAMRQILIERARRRQAVRHGGGQERVDAAAIDFMPATAIDDHVFAVSEALDRLAAIDPLKAELVKLRYFVGLTIEEAAAAMEISVPTAKRWWMFARAWLGREIRRQDSAGP
jgi:RNA polymerase sigma factor (TIGR02999 family)